MNVPVVLCIVAPVGGLVMPYVRLFAGMSVSMAVMFSVNVESSCIVWFDIVFSAGIELTSCTVMVNSWESVAVPSDTVTLMECMPFCDSAGVQMNTPVVVLSEEPVGRLVALLYARLLAGVSASVAFMSNLNLENSCIV